MPAKLKVFSFNIRLDVKEDGINNFFNRTDRIIDCINSHKPDLIGFQEATPAMRGFLRDNLTDYTVVGCGREKNLLGESTAIAFKKDDFEMISLDTFWLSPTPRVPGSKYTEDQSPCPRNCTVVYLKHKDCDKPFYAYNTHLDHWGKMARIHGAMQIMQYASEKGGQFVITGDFNALPDAPEIKLITGSPVGAKDVTASLGGTFHDFGRLEEKQKIDYIFTNAKCDENETFAIEDEGIEGVYISDHYPVCAFVEFE